MPPITLHRNIVESIREYPTIYEFGADVLHHIFCVIGNGFEWRNGRAVEEKFPKDLPENETYIDKDKDAYSRIYWGLPDHIYDFRKNNAEDLAECRLVKVRSLYPLSKRYSLICKVPDDVKADYLEGAMQMWHIAKVSFEEQKDEEKKRGLDWKDIPETLEWIRKDWIKRFDRDVEEMRLYIRGRDFMYAML